MKRETSPRFGFRRLLLAFSVASVLVLGPAAVPGSAQTTDEVNQLGSQGRLLEFGSDGVLDDAIDRANAEGVAFAWLSRPGAEAEAQDLADRFVLALDDAGSRFSTVVVVIDGGFAASSLSRRNADLKPVLDAAFDGFAAGAMGRGLDAFTTALVGGGVGAGAGTTTAPAGTGGSATAEPEPPAGNASGDGGGIGLGTIMLLGAGAGGGFLVFRGLRNRGRDRKQAELDMAEDRAEIKEQLKNNADRVITLGDRVIASDNNELIDLYEKASLAYQDVSQRIDGAETAAEIDELDDLIDEAEWQFEVIEAELDGRPRPPRPIDDEIPQDPSGGHGTEQPQDDSVVVSPRTGKTYPRPPSGGPVPGPAPSSQRRRGGGGLGGALGGGLGGVLADILIGGATGRRGGFGMPSSRRTTRRRTRSGSGSLGGGLGGGVLRRNSGRRSNRPSTRSRSTGRGGRSFGNRRPSGRGGRSF